MKITQGGDMTFEQRGLPHREGTFHFKQVAEGTPGTLDNFQLSISHTIDDFFSPRHRHNFEQYRYQIEGSFDFGRTGRMMPGMVGYFPEGVPYGPQTSDTSAVVAVLQFGGASGCGYISRNEVHAAHQELLRFGEFKGGVFRRNPGVPGKRNMDGFQAIWEHVRKQAMVYPKPRYPAPMLMDPKNYDWVKVAGAPGVSAKLLGVFTERRTEAGFFRLEPGTRHSFDGRGIYLAVNGSGTVEGQPLKLHTTVFVDRGERAAITADTTVELLHFGLPNLDDLRAAVPLAAQAAE